MLPNADDYFKSLTAEAQRLVAAEAAGASTESFDFSATANCGECGNLIMDKPKVCSACKAAVYCSQKCATADWKVRKMPKVKTHKELCADNKRHMLRRPAFTAILMQFPWGRLEKDGTFNDEIARGRFDVLGAEGFGYWSDRGGPKSHLTKGSAPEHLLKGGSMGRGRMGKLIEQLTTAFDYVNGSALFKTQHTNDRDGWKLEPELIPFLTFSSLWVPPRLATKAKIKDWASWYAWRRIPMESPAALLMHFPMSVYWLLVDTLRVADPKAGAPDRRIQLNIQYIGAEAELNFLPLFGELALLLPYTDIKMVVFGQAVHTLVSEAKKSHPKSIAAQASPAHPVYSYTAPEEIGVGRIQIYLHGMADHWTPADADANLSQYGRPDALVAPNAGLGSYHEWYPVIVYAHHTGLAFGATEYAEQSCEFQLTLFQELLYAEAARPGSVMRQVPAAAGVEAARAAAMKHWDHKVEVNPFQRPGQRTISKKMPNAPNGFTIKVVGK
ncbi:hypothetical protein C8R47DRAFT_470378 [Mycena vitilis]|nr:hypothetical protein C8R47DRAFT_470378 [Mycena vitilis]